MKNFLTMVSLTIFAFTIFQSCKKGDNDPAISLRSRDARLIANWKLVKIEGSWDRVVGANHTYSTFTYDGLTFLDNINTGNVGGTGTYEMIIEKGGSMSWNESLVVGNQPLLYNGTGYWKWLYTDKNKTAVNLVGGIHLFASGDFIIDRLAYKELILVQKYNTYDEGDSYSRDFTYTFERQ